MSVDLYKYWPTFVKLRDRLASGITDEDSRETVLAKLTYLLDQMFDDTDTFIQTLLKLNDPDQVDQQYFSHVSYLLGMMLPNGINEDETRFIIKHLVDHYKTSGTHPSWHTAWAWQSQPETKVVELFKHDQQEVANYSVNRSVNHPLQSARIQLGVCTSSCESICVNTCESVCESIVEVGTEVDIPDALRRLAYIEYLRPIHVLLRREAEDVALSSTFPNSSDTLGHYPIEYNVEPDPWRGSEVHATHESEFWTSDDELAVDVQCVALCEVSCQACCEAVCECDPCEVTCQVGGCELQCTENCQGNCEFACEGVCQGACAQGCQAGTCTAQCAGACLGNCQGSCAESCQGGCASSCQGDCASSCQGYCTKGSCTDSCTGLSQMVCGSSCQGDCVSSCQGSCASSCQGYCTKGSCTDSCTGLSQMVCGDSCQADCISGCQDYCMASSCQSGYCMTDSQ